MARPIVTALRRFAENRYVNLTVALIVLLTGLSEAWEELEADLAALDIGTEHGLTVVGLFHLIRVLPEFLEATEYLERGAGAD